MSLVRELARLMPDRQIVRFNRVGKPTGQGKWQPDRGAVCSFRTMVSITSTVEQGMGRSAANIVLLRKSSASQR